MGIPSYFRHLLGRFPALLGGASKAAKKADILLVDFNCLIYGCVRGPTVGPYKAAEREAWEGRVLEEVKSYVIKLW